MSVIGELPFSELSGLISYAEDSEAEEAARPLYIAHFALCKLNGAEPMGYDKYLAQVLSKEQQGANKPRDPSEIEKDFDAIIAADMERTARKGT